MKNKLFGFASLLILSLAIFTIANAASSDHFVIEVTITDGGDTTFTIPTFPGETYDYDVDWNNDQTFEDTNNTGDATYDFTTTGTYTVRITGTFPRIYFNNTGDKAKITDVSQWGTNVWTSMEKAFYGATNMEVTATDSPNLTSVTNMSYMFADVDALDQDLGDWDVSNVTDMSYMFYDADGLMGNAGTFDPRVDYSSAGTSPRYIRTADLNGDGYSDLVTSANDEIKVFFNDGDGTFTFDDSYSASGNNVIFDTGDIDGDGDVDIVRAIGSAVIVYKNDSDGNFTLHGQFITSSVFIGVQLGDIDADSDLDISGVDYSNGLVVTMLNDGNGTFSNLTQYGVYAEMFTIKMGDLNDDGFLDIVAAAAGYTKLFVMINNQDGTYATPVQYGPTHASGYYARGISLVDMDLDGDVDIVGSIKSINNQPVSVMMNNGDGTFASLVSYAVGDPFYTWTVETGDFNGDGYPDVVVSQNHEGNRVTVMLNDGDGTLGGAVDYSVASANEAIAIADFDKDGLLDIASGNSNGTISVLLNKSLGLNHWDTSSVANFSHMFANATTFNQNLSSWNVLYNADLTNMFSGATAFNEDFDNWNILRPSSGPGGLNIEVTASCSVSDTTLKTGEETDIEVDIEATENGDDIPYTFRWTKVLSGSDEETSHSFDTPGEYIIKGQVRTDYKDKTITCDTITVSDTKSSSSSNNDNDDNEEETEDTDTNETSSSFQDIISKYKSFLTTLYNLGINLPSNVLSLLDIKPSSSSSSYTFTQDLELGVSHPQVKLLQQFLNSKGYTVAETGPGSKGNETEMFGYATQAALIKFQEANNITPAQGYFGPLTRAFIEGR